MDLKPDLYKGERAVVIGSGPSLAEMDLDRIEDEYSICFNRFFVGFEYLTWAPDFYMVVDETVAGDNIDEIQKWAPEFETCFFPGTHPSGYDFTRFFTFPNSFFFPLAWGGFPDPPAAGLNGTVAIPAAWILAWLGFNPIYLIGVDMEYKERESEIGEGRIRIGLQDDDPNHFHPAYFGKGKAYSKPQPEIGIEQFRNLAGILYRRGTLLYNAGIGGRLDFLDRVDFKETFP